MIFSEKILGSEFRTENLTFFKLGLSVVDQMQNLLLCFKNEMIQYARRRMAKVVGRGKRSVE
jgi:hypothetical protein